MNEHWQQVRLGDIANFRTGKLNSNASVENGLYPFFTCSPETFRINDYAFDQKAILLAGNNAEGNFNIKYFEGKFNAYQRTYIIDIIHKDDLKYLFYALKLCLNQFKSLSQGTSTHFLTMGILENFSIPLPPLPIQRTIAATLSCLDDKIELNNRINANLEAQAQTIFKSWFVDFEPFQDGEFVDSELGKIPKGWRVGTLGEITTSHNGYSYSGEELRDSAYAMASLKNFDRKGGFKLDGFKEIIPSDKVKAEQFINLFDALVAHTDLTQNAEVIGNCSLLLSKAGYEKIVMSMDLVKVVSNLPEINNFLLSVILSSPLFKRHALGYVNGTTVLHMSKKAIPEYKLAIPNDLSAYKKLGDFLSQLYQMIANNFEESRTLAAIRNILLPRLMSGEIEVEDE
ncbi:type I restriction-modification system subunit S [Spirochaetia bacterium]|nr:type I restriction-modification system subunit S [Spirochaetia bacterium]